VVHDVKGQGLLAIVSNTFSRIGTQLNPRYSKQTPDKGWNNCTIRGAASHRTEELKGVISNERVRQNMRKAKKLNEKNKQREGRKW
jgi:hypothetical protein